MRRLFADAHFYIALLNTGDTYHTIARAVAQEVSRDQLVTSEPIFVEVLAFFSKSDAYGRERAVELVDKSQADARTIIVPQTPELFRAGLDLYRGRLDKSYSLTDCMSMAICEDEGITQVLTHDRHFAQEGYEILT